jgi:hypothetical protein
MDLLETVVTAGNVGMAGYVLAEGHPYLALYSASVAAAAASVDRVVSNYERRQDIRRIQRENFIQMQMEISTLHPGPIRD